ncbi:hypothetical protein [Orrella daihaiensis]|uniref:Phosphoribosyl-AMP cyclohydrolase n=1 Tax=Orrella daihaiensis TaxID=2782176 RepID=A0ABY4AL93_9BURK|nr:hypothetical protein [Orrella daihaiensis]UOD51076.1 hypothetical protein DHf2319_03990 [Orrella daihaiensis]
MRAIFVALASTAAMGLSTAGMASEMATVNRAITEQEVFNAQQAWCKALVDISHVNATQGQAAAKALATQIIDSAYGYQLGTVLFKPTLTVNPQTFRTSRRGAIAYFVGGDSAFPQDSGFALKDWTQCRTDTAGILLLGNSATSMGKVILTDKNGNVVTVDKTWGWVKDDNGQLRIVLHHSSLEHDAN